MNSQAFTPALKDYAWSTLQARIAEQLRVTPGEYDAFELIFSVASHVQRQHKVATQKVMAFLEARCEREDQA